MAEFLVRSGKLCAVAKAEGPIDAIMVAVGNWKTDQDGVLEIGKVIQVIALDECELATTYLNAAGTLALLGFEEPESCGLAVSDTTALPVN